MAPSSGWTLLQTRLSQRPQSREWTWTFAIVGFIVGCEGHVQDAVAGMSTPFLLLYIGATAGGAIDRWRSRQSIRGIVLGTLTDFLLFVAVGAIIGLLVGALFFLWGIGRFFQSSPPLPSIERDDVHQKTADSPPKHLLIAEGRPEPVGPAKEPPPPIRCDLVVDSDRLSAFGLKMRNILEGLAKTFVVTQARWAKENSGKWRLSVRIRPAEENQEAQVEDVVIATRDGQEIRVRDVAIVVIAEEGR